MREKRAEFSMYARDEKWWQTYHKGLAEQSRFLKCRPAREVDQPTYEVVGEIERVDQRDTIQARTMLKNPESPEYKDYYSRHPEKKEADDDMRANLTKSLEDHFKADPLGAYFQSNVFATRHILGLPELIEPGKEGTPLWQTMKTDFSQISREELTARIKDYALFLGSSKVRITRLRKKWVYTHYAHPYTPYPYGKPVDDMDYEYVICLAMRQNPAVVRHGDKYVFCIEAGWRYSLTSLVSITLANLIRSWGFRARALPPENSPYMVVPTFIDAGMGEQGRMGICVAKEFGNNYRPAGVATDLPLMVDKPVDFGLQDFCDKCMVCADACPSGAITKEDRIVRRGVRRWQVNDQKCRSYWNHLGFPCAICQAACPYNFPATRWHNLNRNLNERFQLYRKPAVWGFKLFYEKKTWDPSPQWAYNPTLPEQGKKDSR
jgi:ferredoxin